MRDVRRAVNTARKAEPRGRSFMAVSLIRTGHRCVNAAKGTLLDERAVRGAAPTLATEGHAPKGRTAILPALPPHIPFRDPP